MHKACYIIFFYLIIDLISFTVILPLVPSLFDYYEENDRSGVYKLFIEKIDRFQNVINAPKAYQKIFFGGLIGSWFSLLQYISSPITGSYSDLYGRKICFLVTSIGTLLSYLLWCLSSDSFLMFLISRTIGGMSRGNIGLSTAVMADVLEKDKRGKGMALIGIAFSIGFIVGPTLGGLFTSYVTRNSIQLQSKKFYFLPPIFCVALSAINIFFMYKNFEETLPADKRCKSLKSGLKEAVDYINPRSIFSFKPAKQLKKEELNCLKEIGKIYFLFLFFYSGLEYTLTFLTHIHLNFTSMQQGKMYLFSGLIMTIIQGGFVRKFKSEQGIYIALSGMLFAIPSFLIMGTSQSIGQLYFALFLYAIASATVIPCLTTLASNNSPDSQKGTVLGILRSLGALARCLGPILSSFLFWKFGTSLCYFFGGLSLFLPVYMLYKLYRTVQLDRLSKIQ